MNLTQHARDTLTMRDAILQTLTDQSTGRWQWDRIHCCMTGKDADLEACGQQGIELVSVTDTKVYFNVHCGTTHAGTDVSLNVQPEIENDDVKYEAALDAYLEQAQEVVCSGPGM